MKIKLVESAKPYSKYKNKFERNIIPALEEMGFEFNLSRTLDMNKFESRYFGNYKDHKENTTPFTLTVNTTHKGIDETLDHVFVNINFDGKYMPLGGININKPEEAQDLIDDSLPDRTIKTFTNTTGGKKIDAHDGSIAMTKEEWYNEKKKKFDEFKGGPQYGTWVDVVFPLELAQEELDNMKKRK